MGEREEEGEGEGEAGDPGEVLVGMAGGPEEGAKEEEKAV